MPTDLNNIPPQVDLGNIQMSLAAHADRIVILVESGANEKLFRKLCSKQHRFFPQNGWQKVESKLLYAEKEGLERVIGIIDADFKHITGYEILSQNLFLTDFHDTEIMLLLSEAFENVINFYISIEKKDKHDQKYSNIHLKDFIFELCRPLALMRYLKERKNLNELTFRTLQGEKFYYLDYELFIDTKTATFLGDKKLMQAIENKSSKLNYFQNNPALIKAYQIFKEEELAIVQLINGHDAMNILALLLKKYIGSKEAEKLTGEELTKDFIKSYRISDFLQTNLYQSLANWEANHFPYKIVQH